MIASKKAAAEPGSQGIILLPFFNGERTPPLPNGCGTYYGLSSFNFTRENICRSTMEGATMGLKYGMNILAENGITPKEIRLVGGGSKSKLWRKMAADMFGFPVVSPFAEEAGALGAALQAYWCWYNEKNDQCTITSVVDRFVKMDPDTFCEPDRENNNIYDALFEQYSQLNTTLMPLFR